MPLYALTSLRFIAAIAVVLSHLKYLLQSDSVTLRTLSGQVFGEGYIGVTFFFILSGFILSHSYSNKMSEGTLSKLQFMWARVARIYPLHLCTLVISLPLVLWNTGPFWLSFFTANFAANAILVQAFIPDVRWHFGFNSPSWSLSVEMLLYVTFPFLIGMRTRVLAILATVLMVVKLSFLLQPDGGSHFTQYIFPPLRLFDFVVGILSHRVWVRYKEIQADTATIAQVVSVATLVMFMAISPMVIKTARYDLFYVVPMVGIVLAFGFQQGQLARAISGRIWVILGEASFALYMLHNLVIQYGELVRVNIFPNSTIAIDLVISFFYVSTSVVLSVLVFRFFEMPAKLAVLRFFNLGPTVSARMT